MFLDTYKSFFSLWHLKENVIIIMHLFQEQVLIWLLQDLKTYNFSYQIQQIPHYPPILNPGFALVLSFHLTFCFKWLWDYISILIVIQLVLILFLLHISFNKSTHKTSIIRPSPLHHWVKTVPMLRTVRSWITHLYPL